jgi:hypothetical protein
MGVMGVRKLRSVALALLCAAFAIAAFGVVSARAELTHEFLRKITEVPAEGPGKEPVASHGPIVFTHGIGFDAGEVWVAEAEAGVERVDAFSNSTGGFESQITGSPSGGGSFARTIGVRGPSPVIPETGVYVGESNNSQQVSVYSQSGVLRGVWNGADTPNGSFTEVIAAIAVDDSESINDWATGDVYVATSSQSASVDNVVDVFKPKVGGGEEYVGQLPGPEGGYFSRSYGRSLAVDQVNGDVVVGEGEVTERKAIYVFEPTAVVGQYALVRTITGTPEGAFKTIDSVAVDPGSGDIYAALGEGEKAIDQFTATGVFLGRLTGTPEGPFTGVVSIGIDPETGDLYAGAKIDETSTGEESGFAIDVFGPSVVLPDVATGEATGVSATDATLTGTVDPNGEGPAECQFVWGTSESFGETQPCSGPVEGNVATPVHVALGGKLRADTTYYYRLQASNEHGLNAGGSGQDHHFTTPGPGIEQESVSDVAASSATIEALIEPHGAPTSYYFQYGPSSSYGTDAPVAPGTPIGSANAEVGVSQHLQSLAPGTLYHYRVVAVSEPKAGEQEVYEGADETFTTQLVGAFSLPDGRAWEMVSPPDKHGANIEPDVPASLSGGSITQAAAGGGALTYVADSPTEAEPAGYSNLVQQLSHRGPQGWSSHGISSPSGVATGASAGQGSEYRFFSEDLSFSVVQPFGPFTSPTQPGALSAEASEQTPFMHTDFQSDGTGEPCSNGCYRPLVTGAPGFANVPEGTTFGKQSEGGVGSGGSCPPYPLCGPVFRGATPDASHVVLESQVPLTTPPDPARGLYEWSAGKLQLINLLPESEGGGPSNERYLYFGYNSASTRNAISSDGARVVWATESHLYLRDTVKGETVRLDTAQGGSGGYGVPQFQDAASDGSRVFFTDSAYLTQNSGGGRGDLYECAIVEVAGKLACRLTDLTPSGPSGRANVPNGKNSVLGVSEDGSWVYFVAGGVLAPGAVHGDCMANSSPCNLYVYHDHATKLVAVLSDEDNRDWEYVLKYMTSRVSPNGLWLTFLSQRELTGYVTRDAVSGHPDEEVYLYDAQTERLVCASCNPTAARPVGIEYGEIVKSNGIVGGESGDGSSVWPSSVWLAADLPGWTAYTGSSALYQSRYLSNSGRLFFDSNDALSSRDVNGTWDVYEYEPAGVVGCTTSNMSFAERSDGCVGLISSGTSGEESAFMDASEGGEEAFFLTNAKLVPQDLDTSLDVYDAHECTESSPCFPSPVPQPPPCTTGDACRPGPTPQPAIFGVPASATFSGAGNVTASAPEAAVKPKALTRAQKLANALRACHRRKGKRRVLCEKSARARYGTASTARGKGRGTGRSK